MLKLFIAALVATVMSLIIIAILQNGMQSKHDAREKEGIKAQK